MQVPIRAWRGQTSIKSPISFIGIKKNDEKAHEVQFGWANQHSLDTHTYLACIRVPMIENRGSLGCGDEGEWGWPESRRLSHRTQRRPSQNSSWWRMPRLQCGRGTMSGGSGVVW